MVDVTVSLIGTEQVDPAYISATFHKDNPANPVRNSRRLSRTIFSTPPIQLLQACSLQPGERRCSTVRCVHGSMSSLRHTSHASVVLPEHLPPTFKGTCVKFDYSFQAEARYVLTVCLLVCAPHNASFMCQQAAAARVSVPESSSESVLATLDTGDDAASMADLRSQASGTVVNIHTQSFMSFFFAGVSVTSQAPPPLSTAAPGTAVMQSMLLKVPLQLWSVRLVIWDV